MAEKRASRQTKAEARRRTAKARAARRDRTNAARRAVQLSQVVQLRVKEGKGFGEIAGSLGISVGQAHKLLEEALTIEQGVWGELAERHRKEQLAQLERLEGRLLPMVMDPTLQVVETKEDGSVMELEEFERVTKVSDRLLKVWERRSKLLGLDAPVKHAVATGTGFETLEAIQARLRESRRREGRQT